MRAECIDLDPAYATFPAMAKHIVIHADESCIENQVEGRASPGGAAGVLEMWKKGAWVRRDYWVSEPDTTHDQMALTSAIVPLSSLKPGRQIRFVSHSRYLVAGMSERLSDWKASDWQREGEPIDNLALWKQLDHVTADHHIRWELAQERDDDAHHEYVRDLARRAARNQQTSDGLIESGFDLWLEEERKEGRYGDFAGSAPPR